MSHESREYSSGRLRRLAVASVLGAGLLLAGGTALAENGGFSKLAKELAELRSTVDSLTTKVDRKEREMKSRLRSIRRQRAEIERKIEKQEMRLQRLRRKRNEHREKVEKREASAEKLEPAVERAVETLRDSVREGPPFKRDKRLKQLSKLESEMNEGLRSPQKTVSRLWQFVEDELRLSRENGMYDQVIELGDEEVLAEVVRVGMVAMYFRTEKGRTGYAVRTDSGWTWRETDSEKASEHIDDLFESFRKNIRVGYFTLPNGIRGIERVESEGG